MKTEVKTVSQTARETVDWAISARQQAEVLYDFVLHQNEVPSCIQSGNLPEAKRCVRTARELVINLLKTMKELEKLVVDNGVRAETNSEEKLQTVLR